MKIIIAHYHLHPGGVTKIIDSQIKSLINTYPETEVELICGYAEKPSMYTDLGVNMTILPLLNYMQKEEYSEKEARMIYENLYEHFTNHAGKEDIIHFHNLNLGKNPAATYCLYQMALEGYHIVNHTHDFPEDRPENMKFLKYIISHIFNETLETVLYPSDITNYRIGVINTNDKERLIDRKFPAEHIVYLPNPVEVPEIPELHTKERCREEIVEKLEINPDKLIVTYPVRVIRRKNIGELILLSELFKDKVTFLVTMGPQNPIEIEFYNKWLTFCQQNNLKNIHFEVNHFIDFNKLLRGSDFCITTSTREGFGMTFMEPWLYDTPVTGRDIPYVTKDFFGKGLRFPNLYDQIVIGKERKDFKDFPMEKQMEVILNIKDSKLEQSKLFTNNLKLSNLFNTVDHKLIAKNKKLIIDQYSFENYGKTILETYQSFSGGA